MSVHELVESIRTLVNEPRRQALLCKDKKLWYQLCSSLDVLGDTQLAIASYRGIDDEAPKGVRYLALYGLLQSMIVQQDAAWHLSEALGFPSPHPSKVPELAEVRETRIRAIGHPTKRDRPSLTYHFVSRPSLTQDGFTLLSFNAMGVRDDKSGDYSIPDLTSKQDTGVGRLLQKALEQLEQQQEEHRSRFKSKPLAAVLNGMVSYYFEKISESITNRDKYGGEFTIGLLRDIREQLSAFEQALSERELEQDAYPGVQESLDMLKHALAKLIEFFQSAKVPESTPMHEKDAHIFFEFCRLEFSGLVSAAAMIDKSYE